MRRPWIIALLLAAATLALYWPVRQFDIVYFDDPLLLNDNHEVQAGFTWAGVKWAFSSVVIANWQPVTNLSFLLVSQFFGIAPGAHHLANAAIHAANAGLLFLLLWRLTKSMWRSGVAAAIFAWHPLRVESVAWIAERKDVLCAFFFLLAIWFYTRFAQEISGSMTSPPGKRSPRSRIFYGAGLISFALALLSKPMAVTLPGVLLLLDAWPLGRLPALDWPKLKRLILEKIPFFVLMFGFCVATCWIQHDYAAMTPWEKLGLAPRVANAISGYVAYPAQLIWPVNLVIIYPYPKSFDDVQVALKAALLVAVSAACFLQYRQRPWLAVGWLWYLGTALPIIGIVQVGEQAMADRYTYLPLIGPVVAATWTISELFSTKRVGRIAVAAAAVAALSVLAVLTERQLQFWRNTVSLFAHNVAVTPNNASAMSTLGLGFEHAGDTNHAVVCYRVARMIEPRDVENRRCLANLLIKEGHLAAAEHEYRTLQADEPTQGLDYLGLAGVLAAQGRVEESIVELNEVLQFAPDYVDALNNLAWALATNPRAEVRDGPRAVALARHACELTGFNQTICVGTLAAAQAETGKFDDAAVTAERACTLAASKGETNLLQRNQQLLELYRNHKAARD